MDRKRPDDLDYLAPTLATRKEQFKAAARGVDPLISLKRHPFLTVGTAALLGLTVGSPHAASAAKKAKSSLTSRLAKTIGLRVLQHFVSSRMMAKAAAAASAAGIGAVANADATPAPAGDI